MTDQLAVFVGVATEDSIAVVDRYPGADERIVAEGLVFGGGGPAATAAVAAARAGIPSAVVAAVGDDESGERVRQRLADEGVDVSGIVTVTGAETSRSIVIISGEERSRAIVNRVGPHLELTETSIAMSLIRAAQWVHVDQHGWQSVHAAREQIPESAQLSIDGGNTIRGLELERTALYAPTRESLEDRYGSHDIEKNMRRALADGAQSVVVTDGGEGARGLRADGESARVTPPTSEVVSTLGAGDVFHGALIAGLMYEKSGLLTRGFEAAIEYATTAATLSCRGIDGRTRIPSHDETMRMLER